MDAAASPTTAGSPTTVDGRMPGAPTGLRVEQLTVRFATRHGEVRALDQLDLVTTPGRIRTVIGESGSGKSVLAAAILGLLPRNTRIDGTIVLDGHDLTGLAPQLLEAFRARRVGYIPQSPATALNPVRRIGPLAAELAAAGHRVEVRERLTDAFEQLGLDFNRLWHHYPHQLSGGMQQRVVTAVALARQPSLLIADEPTSGLDADRVEDTADQLQLVATTGATVLVITHDLGLVQRLDGDTAVLYAGQVVEDRPTRPLLDHPAHPYTAALLAATPERGLTPIPGHPPSLVDPAQGCRFHPRCLHREPSCLTDPTPALIADGTVRCIRHA